MKHDVIFILILSFYLASLMPVTPLIAGYSESLGVTATIDYGDYWISREKTVEC